MSPALGIPGRRTKKAAPESGFHSGAGGVS